MASRPPLLAPLPPAARWGVLACGSLALSAGLAALHLPAALLLGAMVVAIAVALEGGDLAVPKLPLEAAQALIGCLIARSLTPQILHAFAAQWPVFLGAALATVVASGLLGRAIGRLGILPGSTAIWGLLPGAASAMMLMAEAFGADARLVAFMQYSRVLVVALAASLVARLYATAPAPSLAAAGWFPALDAPGLAATLALAAFGLVAGRLTRAPAGALLITMGVGAVLHVAGLVAIVLPPWLLAASYAALGWSIGLRFTRDVIAAAAKGFAQTFFSIGLLVAFCGAIAALLVWTLHIDPLTAYLATSPGGADAVAIIAASSPVDVSFVMTLQTARLLVVITLGPRLSRWLARGMERQA